MSEIDLKQIEVPEEHELLNVRKAMKEKNPKLLKWLPGFFIRYIERTLHQKEMNAIIYKNRNLNKIDFLNAGLEDMGVKVEWSGLENIPLEGGAYFTANHPLGGLDGVAMIKAVSEKRSDIKFFVNDILMQIKKLEPYFIPVNKHGKNSKEYREKFEKTYASDQCLLIFPAGLVSRRQEKREIKDLIWKKSIIQKSIQYNKPIIPVYIKAKNSKRFYNIAYYRKKFGIKANIEMFFLADEMFRQRGKTIKFTFGKPIPASQFNKTKKPAEWVQWLKEHVYNLTPNKMYL